MLTAPSSCAWSCAYRTSCFSPPSPGSAHPSAPCSLRSSRTAACWRPVGALLGDALLRHDTAKLQHNHLDSCISALAEISFRFANHNNMKKFLKVIGILLAVLVLIIIGGLTYITQALPDIPVPKDLHVELTPERLARGEYLANCSGLHGLPQHPRLEQIRRTTGARHAGEGRRDLSQPWVSPVVSWQRTSPRST